MNKSQRAIRAGCMVMAMVLACSLIDVRGASGSARISGDVGFAGELYNVSAGESRRPSSSARLFLRPTITLYNSLTLSLDLTLSTEGNSARQDINQFHTNPKWKWGEAHLGDFSQQYSSLSLNGVQIRGGGLSLFTGAFHVSAVSGATRREVSGVNNYRSYKRHLSAARIGVGNDQSSHVSLIVVSARDDLSAQLDSPVDSTTDTDTTLLDSVVNPSSVTPMENLVVALETQLSFATRDW